MSLITFRNTMTEWGGRGQRAEVIFAFFCLQAAMFVWFCFFYKNSTLLAKQIIGFFASVYWYLYLSTWCSLLEQVKSPVPTDFKQQWILSHDSNFCSHSGFDNLLTYPCLSSMAILRLRLLLWLCILSLSVFLIKNNRKMGKRFIYLFSTTQKDMDHWHCHFLCPQ